MECNYKFMFFSAPRLKGRGVEVLFGKLNAAVSIRLKRVFQST